jgi:hypothetical protein
MLSILVETEVGLVIGVDARKSGCEKRGREGESSMVLSVYATAFSLYMLGWLPKSDSWQRGGSEACGCQTINEMDRAAPRKLCWPVGREPLATKVNAIASVGGGKAHASRKPACLPACRWLKASKWGAWSDQASRVLLLSFSNSRTHGVSWLFGCPFDNAKELLHYFADMLTIQPLMGGSAAFKIRSASHVLQ